MERLESFEAFREYLVSLAPIEVERFVSDILSSSGDFQEVTLNPIVNDRHVDITFYQNGSAQIRQFWVVEIKSYRSFLPVNVIDAFYGKFVDLIKAEPNCRLLVISTSGYKKAAIERAQRIGVLLWGPHELYAVYRHAPIRMAITHSPEPPEESEVSRKANSFKRALIRIEPGKNDWSKYQSLVVDILEFLLCPPLEAPKVELADSDKRNRRDIIFENASEEGFWLRIRDIYQGHYIVVDAKNYSKPLTKRPILDISHYLKPYGCGMFSIITSRHGYSSAGKHAAKEQWIGNKKLIVPLSDEDLIRMLDLKAEGAPPEDVLKEYISEFRMSL